MPNYIKSWVIILGEFGKGKEGVYEVYNNVVLVPYFLQAKACLELEKPSLFKEFFKGKRTTPACPGSQELVGSLQVPYSRTPSPPFFPQESNLS